MNYYQARQRGTGGPWHFTSANRRGGTHPVGCTAECTHATPEEACQHWVETEIAKGVRHGKCAWTTCDVPDCGGPAREMFEIGGQCDAYPLCEAHADDETAIGLFRDRHKGSFQIASIW